MTLSELLARFADLRILVTGDPMVDVYHFGRVERMCPEAPVPVFLEDRVERRNGGAANARDQLEALGCKTENTFPLYGLWTEKHRYLVGHQLMWRIDHDVNIAADWAGHDLSKFNALLVSDYRKGACLGPALPTHITKYRDASIPVVVDPKGAHWQIYEGASVICPNSRELEGRYVPAADYPWTIIEKRGAAGLRLHASGGQVDFPATARHVFDVTGAGDTVSAVVTATIAAGGTLDQACVLANLAAGYVVGEVGTTVCPGPILQSLLP